MLAEIGALLVQLEPIRNVILLLGHVGDIVKQDGLVHVRAMNTPLNFYIEKLGYAGVYLFFLFLFQNIYCGYSLEPPR